MIEGLRFHHIGIACKDLSLEQSTYELQGYAPEAPGFEDPIQGIKGRFLVATNQPRLELVAPLDPANPGFLADWLARNAKMYHLAYLVPDIDKALASIKRGKVMVKPVPAVAFKGRPIAFVMMPNMLLLEFIQDVKLAESSESIAR